MGKQQSVLSGIGEVKGVTDLKERLRKWQEAGLITAEQAEAISAHEALAERRRVSPREIFLYIGGLFVLMAVGFGMQMRWDELGSLGRVVVVAVPTLILWATGEALRRRGGTLPRRGAQVLWVVASLLTALSFGVIFNELDLIDDVNLLILASSLLATGVAGVAFALLTTVAQSVAFHLLGSLAWFSLHGWILDTFYPYPQTRNHWLILVIWLVGGGLWLALSEWLRARGRKDLMAVSRVFGALTILGGTLSLAMDPERFWAVGWHKTAMEAIAFLASIAFIAASVKRQSQVFLYSGAAFLLLTITYVNFEHFADRIGMPIALLITGVVLIGLGLGTGRLSRWIRAAK